MKFLTEYAPWIAAGIAGVYFDLSGWQWFQLFGFVLLGTQAFSISVKLSVLLELARIEGKLP